MSSANAHHGPRWIARLIAAGIAVTGAYALLEFLRDAHGGDWHWLEVLLNAVVILLCAGVAYYGWFARSSRSIRWLCGMAAFILYAFLLAAMDKSSMRLTGFSLIHSPARPDLKTTAILALLSLIPTIFAILFYYLTKNWLTPRLGLIDDRSPRGRLHTAQVSWGLIALTIFVSAGEVQSRLPDHSLASPPMLELVIGFAPLLIAYAVYKLGIFLTARRIASTSVSSLAPSLPPTHS
ncbi:MAG TPA: hypothetical protein VGG19_20020 [Tepidisphaeraceae bacterium]|jgi:hypothetical protein